MHGCGWGTAVEVPEAADAVLVAGKQPTAMVVKTGGSHDHIIDAHLDIKDDK